MIAALVVIVAATTPEVAVGWSRSLTRVCSHRRMMISSSSLSSHQSSSSPSSYNGKDEDTERITDNEEQSNFESIENDHVDEGKRQQLYTYVSRLEAIYDNDLIPYNILGGQINLADLFPSSLDTPINDDDESTQREQGRRRRVIFRDWLNHQEEGGVESEQCEIPEEYKMTTSSDIPKVDVMAFLGIHRAKPIAKAKTVFREWD